MPAYPQLLDALREREQLDLDVYWVPTGEADELKGFDGVWLLPGSPYEASREHSPRSSGRARAAYRSSGTCAGFQHALLEFARNVCGATDAQHAEINPDADDLFIVPLACSLVGHEGAIRLTPGTAAATIVGSEHSIERYHCSYGLDTSRLDLLRDHGLVFSAYDDAGDPRIAELPTHPFFLATLFQPELAGDGSQPHPIIRAFAQAAATAATASAASGGQADS